MQEVFEKEQEASLSLPEEATPAEEAVRPRPLGTLTLFQRRKVGAKLTCLFVLVKTGDSKAKTKVWQNKSKGTKKAAKSKKKKLTKKKATPAPVKAKQANGNVAAGVSNSIVFFSLGAPGILATTGGKEKGQ